MEVTGTGIWDRRLRDGDPGAIAEYAAELEELGYSALWFHDVGGDIFGALGLLMSATRRVTVGTGILNLWMHTPAETAAGRAALIVEHGRAPFLGIGVSHAPIINAIQPGRFTSPLETTREYLDALDAADPPVPVDERLLAALRPKMLELASERSRGAMPYHMPPEQTRRAREVLGPSALLAPEQAVLLETDPEKARTAGRTALKLYMGLPNYVNAWRWLGFSDDDLTGGGSDRFVDAVVAWGDEDAIRRRVQEHRDAGADHVCIQVISDDEKGLRETWRSLAPALLV
jgi:probable F420-dependent oxidoreductase